MSSRLRLPEALRALLKPGMVVFVHAGPAEAPALRAALAAEPDLGAGVTFTGAFMPGINVHDYAAGGASVTSPFVPPSSRGSFEAGRHRLLPTHWSDLTRRFAAHGFDLAILHCPPGRGGRVSLGLNADFAGVAARAARRRLLIANPLLPWTGGHETVQLREDDVIVEDASAPLAPSRLSTDATSEAVARHVAALVRDGDVLQAGIGKIPGAVLGLLADRRGLRVHSGIVGDEVATLVEAGAVNLDATAAIVCGSAWGGARVHALVADGRVAVAPASVTHDLARIAATERFTALNSAIEVDLFGQVNGEAVDGRRVSGVGGANDFARGARLSRDGRSIVALPSVAARRSRIVPTLAPGCVSQAAADADVVVTEHGVAALRDLTLDERAERLIAISDPAHRSGLAESWREIRASL